MTKNLAGCCAPTCLRHQKKRYRRRYGSPNNRTRIPNRVDIDERLEEANKRERVGDFEVGTVIGKNHKGALLTMDDRETKLRLAATLPEKKTQYVKDAMIMLLTPVKDFVLTLTYDNRKEFAEHEAVSKSLSCQSYFAKPYRSYKRGQNENANGLLRQYFPKQMELDKVSQQEVIRAVHKLNHRPRNCLDYKTPYEAFEQETGIDVRKLLGYELMT